MENSSNVRGGTPGHGSVTWARLGLVLGNTPIVGDGTISNCHALSCGIVQNGYNRHAKGDTMEPRKLSGRSILIAASNIETALDLQDHLADAGARVFTAYRIERALELAEHTSVAAAVIDSAPGIAPVNALCQRLIDLDIPIALYCENSSPHRGEWPNVPIVTALGNIVDTVAGVVNGSAPAVMGASHRARASLSSQHRTPKPRQNSLQHTG